MTEVLYSHSSGGQKSEIKMLTGPLPPKALRTLNRGKKSGSQKVVQSAQGEVTLEAVGVEINKVSLEGTWISRTWLWVGVPR